MGVLVGVASIIDMVDRLVMGRLVLLINKDRKAPLDIARCN